MTRKARTSLPTFALERKSFTPTNAAWSSVTNATTQIGRRNRVTLTPGNTNLLYRLRSSP